MAEFKNLIIEKQEKIGIIKLNRPKAMNALCQELMDELVTAIDDFEKNEEIKVLILTGNEKAFAAGADIKEMAPKSFMDVYKEDFITTNWERIAKCRKPIIAAVSGYCLGGGCELAMMCDFIIASETAKFAQPEVTIGTIPGIGGTQRLTRIIGKSKAMDMCLTGRILSVEEAENAGLVARVFPVENFLKETIKIAEKIAGFSSPITMMLKESVNRAYETTLSEGLKFERRMFHSTFATSDQKEGMSAFTEKRNPKFNDK